MKAICPKCHQELPSSAINIAEGVAHCERCREIYSLHELTLQKQAGDNLEADRQILSQPPPKGTELLTIRDDIVFLTPQSKVVLLFLVPFMLIWSGGSLGGIYGTQIYKGEFDLFQSLFGIPFLLASIFFWGMIVAIAFGKMMVRITEEGVYFKYCVFRKPEMGSVVPRIQKHGSLSGFWTWEELDSICFQDRQRTALHSSPCQMCLPNLPKAYSRYLIALLRTAAWKHGKILDVNKFMLDMNKYM